VNRNWLRALTVATVLAAAMMSAGALLGGRAGVILAAVVVAAAAALALVLADRVTLAAMRARPVGEVEYPQLYRAVREITKAARLPVPRVYVSPALAPNSFAIGRSRRAAKVCCTEGLLQLLSPAELRAVLAHELAHIRAHDTMATSFCAGLAAVITSLASPAWLRPAPVRLGFIGRPEAATRAEPETAGFSATLVMLVVGPLAGLLLQLSLSRRREYRADALAATWAGDPLALAQALRKIEAETVELPLSLTGPLASASPLMLVNPFSCEGLTRLFSTHPPTGERVFRLEGLAGYPR